MRTLFRTLATGALLALALPCFAQSDTSAFAETGFNGRMLDASVPKAERMKLFANVIKLANQGQVKAMDLAGTMYWQGSKIVGSPVDTNLAQAHKLLANAAIHGDQLAMAKMAEIQLQAHQVTKAMIWAELYGHYIDPTRRARGFHGRQYAYVADLMMRIKNAGGKVGATVQNAVNNMATRFDTTIRAGIDAQRKLRRSGDFQFTRFPRRLKPFTSKEINLTGWSEFVVAFKPDGSIEHVWQIASWPIDDIATMMRPAVDYALANKSDASKGVRYRVLSMPHYAHKAHTVKAHH